VRIHTDEAETIEIGGNGYISKPIDKSKLIDHINNQMTSARYKKRTNHI
jgi:PleD family two-component response regulator